MKNASITYEQVQAAFRKLALTHHPDTAEKQVPLDGNSIKNGNNEEFTRIRQAFESIVEGPGGIALLRDQYSEISQEHQTNDNSSSNELPNTATHLHPTLNPSILREVAEVADMSPGGLDRGGMWQYAKMVKNMAQEEGLPPLQLEGVGEVKTRRRRKKK